ncbi:response regulator transcription factor [Pedobacter sp. JY14-1]|uniref:response regulator n=1 Tax=Pedobacter sp. JY14-1 TaxID=3034151 RepID=UPI0023E1BF1B|nr:response regulator transcription factor [Pedobacter sp. JY14-1]
MLRVILAEDHNIVRNGIRMLLEADSGIHISGEATNGLEVLNLLDQGTKADVILADINMPVMDGIMLLRELNNRTATLPVLFLSMIDNEKYVAQAFSEGASGYLFKNVSADELMFALRHVSAGGRYICSELSLTLLEKLLKDPYPSKNISDTPIDFSEREFEILHLIAEGMTNQEISEKLFISKRTVEGHRQSLLEKTGSRNTATLIRFAIMNRLIS